MRVLVTGAAGYIGCVLVAELLDAGYDVTGLDNLSCGVASLAFASRHPRFRFVHGDVRDEATMRSVLADAEAIFPLAAVVGMPACDRDPVAAREINVASIRLLVSLRSKEQRIVFPNTNSGYGSRETGTTHCTEETPLEPVSRYGQYKAEAEKIVLDAENTVSLRLATVFGWSPRMRRDLLVNAFVWEALRARRIEVYAGHTMRNYVYAGDVARTFRKMIFTADHTGRGAYNLGNDAINLSKLDLAKTIAAVVSTITPGESVRVSERPGTDPDRRNYIVSSAKLARLGIEAVIGLRAGVDELVRAYRCLPEFYA